MKLLVFALLMTCLAASAFGCGAQVPAAAPQGDAAASEDPASSTPDKEPDLADQVEASSQGDPAAGGEHSESSEDDSDAAYGVEASSSGEARGEGSSSSGEDAGSGMGGSEDEDVAAYENPGLTPLPFDSGRNDALAGAEPLDVVTWTLEPEVSFGALEAEGILGGGAALFDPAVEGEGAGFIVYFKGIADPLAVLLPDEGPLHIWETYHTVAPADIELDGPRFTIRAYSPLFMDIGPSDLEIRVFGYDSGGEDALLSVRAVSASYAQGSPGGDDSGDHDVVSNENPGQSGRPFDSGRNDALAGAGPLDAVTWTLEPEISFGALEAEGMLAGGAELFDPMVEGEGAGFIVYFRGHEDPLALLLPDIGPLHIWETYHTVAPAEIEVAGSMFTIRAYSPLFMDVGPSDLELRLFGYDPAGGDALLAVRAVTVPDAGGHADMDGPGDEDVASFENPGYVGLPFDASRNDALAGAEPLDVVTWTLGPVVSFGALDAAGVLGDGASLFDPRVDGEGAGFIVYFRGNPDPLLLLLPDPGSLYIWETHHTVAPTDLEIEGASFSITAYSPLFMDVGPSDLEIRLFGYDSGGNDAVLGVHPVTTP